MYMYMQGVLLVFDITKRESLYLLPDFLTEIDKVKYFSSHISALHFMC